ncbi:MAG: prolipoprotein diacylglyceryl transferase [Kofleriaceae bacterium]|nr:prolipoprotein diacylglyceryl transferase [Myxococcales bacterium]MCB9562394.1 prolipoprotein diacylglyceryl transferase [Kofleriaceae bacterium]
MWTLLFAGAAGLFAGSAQTSHGLPFFEMGHIDLFGLKLQYFGMLVATGVLVGAHLMRKLSERFGVDDDDLRGITAWIVVAGFIGAHVFDVLAYQSDKLSKEPLLLFKLWQGISSYGGFIGGVTGWGIYIWWKRLTPGLWGDLTMVGFMPGFTIGRIGCTVVSDHMGRQTDFFLGMDYPYAELVERGHCRISAVAHGVPLCPEYPNVHVGDVVRIHNLGLYELLYLIPVCALLIYIGFRKKPHPAGLIAALSGLLYAPVRFFLEYLRLNETDPRYVGLTFAQWASIAAFSIAAYYTVHLLRHGTPSPRADELADGAIGGRLHRGPKITRKHLAELDAQERAEKAADKAKAAGAGGAKAKAGAKSKADAKADAKAKDGGKGKATKATKAGNADEAAASDDDQE